MSFPTPTVRQLTRILIVGLFCLLLYLFLGSAFRLLYTIYQNRSLWRAQTIPLNQTTREDLCLKFRLTDSNLCDGTTPVYAPEFFPAIKNFFGDSSVSLSPTTVTRHEVDQKLGDYLTTCARYGEKFIKCDYDLAGDSAFPIIVFYNIDDTLYNISASTE